MCVLRRVAISGHMRFFLEKKQIASWLIKRLALKLYVLVDLQENNKRGWKLTHCQTKVGYEECVIL